MNIQVLGAEDLAAYRVIRRRALVEHPDAFGMTPAEHDAMSDETVTQRMIGGLPQNGLLGAFVDDALVGIVYVARHQRQKTQHRAQIDAMYVVPEQRGRKVGYALMQAALDHLRGLGGVTHVALAVTVGNTPARHLYRSVGFVPWGIDPGLIRVDEAVWDVEWMVLTL